MTTVKEILAQASGYTPEDEALVQQAYEFAQHAHRDHTRYSGEPYFTHPAAVAKHLAELGMDAKTVAAALLHDSIEDVGVTPEQIRNEFGSEVLFLVEGVTKLGKHKYQGGERHAESLRRLLVATASDVRVLIVKLADRYHNMTTLMHVPEEKQRRIALETLEIYAPIADRLGMGILKRDLEDLAFPAIDPDAHQHALEVRKLKKKETEEGLARAQKTLQYALVKRGIQDFATSIRMKGLWSLHQKLKRKKDDITRIHDIAALRVVVTSVDDCYATLGVIHALWRPLPGEFKDYISFPKPNGYQSLHTTVMTSEAGIVEMQIRTRDMHHRAQFGIASHMSYKSLTPDAGKTAFQKLSFPWIRDLVPALLNIKRPQINQLSTPSTDLPDVPRWLTDLKEAHAEVVGSDEFVAGLKSDFFSHRIFVFTPRGDVIDLPLDSTPVDFAYAIHSDLGDHMQGAKVNEKLVSFDTPLANGDVIEILRSKTARPTAKWLDYARTSMARRHIRASLDASERGRPHAETPRTKKERIKTTEKEKKVKKAKRKEA